MGFLRRVAGQFVPDLIDDYIHSPYDGESYPDGTFGAVAVPGELEIQLPPGKVEAVYRVWGTPRFWDRQKNKHWIPPKFELAMMPVDPHEAPRLKLLEDHWQRKVDLVLALGWSRKRLYTFEVPAPGGRYKVTITGVVTDDQAHVILKPD